MVLWHIIFLSPAIIVGFIGLCMLIASVSETTGSAIGLSAILLLLSIIYMCIYSIATFIPNWAILIRRFHDTGRTMVMPLVYLGSH